MCKSEESVYEKSERLFQELLDNKTGEEFLKSYGECEKYVVSVIDDLFSCKSYCDLVWRMLDWYEVDQPRYK